MIVIDKFQVTPYAGGQMFLIRVSPMASNIQEVKDRREFIEAAIREKLERHARQS